MKEGEIKVLDLFCGAGGCAAGYYKAGLVDITGIDNEPQKNYPFPFIQADAIQYLAANWHKYHFVHASPPCQRWSKQGKGITAITGKKYPDYITPLRKLLESFGLPYVIENVPWAPIRPDVKLYGTMFGLRVRRERWFELGNGLFLLSPMRGYTSKTVTNGQLVTIAGHGSSKNRRRIGKRLVTDVTPEFHQGSVKATWAMALGINWMTKKEMSQAIPPAYTEWIGNNIISQLKSIYK